MNYAAARYGRNFKHAVAELAPSAYSFALSPHLQGFPYTGDVEFGSFEKLL